MNACPNCGRDNPLNATVCMECGEVFQRAESDIIFAIPPKKAGMHWVWAFLIMNIARIGADYLITMILYAFMESKSAFFIYAHALEMMNIDFTVKLAVYFLSILLWISLTTRRYLHSAVWSTFVYIWIIFNPLLSISQYKADVEQLGFQPNYVVFAGVASMAAGVIVFLQYQKKLEKMLRL